MSIKTLTEWAFMHTDATHPGNRYDCDQCQEMIAAFGNMPSEEALLEEMSRIPSTKNNRKKKHIPESIRWKVWERDNFTCKHCGDRRFLSVDHIYPESKGGTLTLGNLQTLCRSCNSKKGATL